MQASNVSEAVQSKSLEALDGALATLINKTVSGIDSATAFLGEQIPDVIHQLLMWEAISNGALGLLLTLPLIVYLVLIKKGMRLGEAHAATNYYREQVELYAANQRGWGRNEKGTYTEEFLAFAFVGGIAVVTSFGFSIPQFADFLKILIAPKLFLIEYAATLLK